MDVSLFRKIENARKQLVDSDKLYYHRIGAVFDIAHDLEPISLPLNEIPEEDRGFYVSAREFKRLLSYYQLKNLSLEQILVFNPEERVEESPEDNLERLIDAVAEEAESEPRGIFDAVEVFQQEIGVYRPLSEEEEERLTRSIVETKKKFRTLIRETCVKCRIKSGRLQYYEDIKEALKSVEGIYLETRTKNSRRAKWLEKRMGEIKEVDTEYYFLRQRMTKHNLRLVFFLAKKYLNRELPLLDLIQEGNIGLMKAVDRYQPGKGSFSTYAGWYIEGYMRRSLAQHARTVRLPVHVISTIKKLYEIYEEFVHEYGREPSYAELAKAALLPLKKVKNVMESGQPAVSLHSKVEGKEGELGDYLEDDRAEDPAKISMHNLLREQLGKALFLLNEREKEVINLRFGIVDGQPRTLEEIGRAVKLTRERVRQIEKEGLKKLAESEDLRPMREFIG